MYLQSQRWQRHALPAFFVSLSAHALFFIALKLDPAGGDSGGRYPQPSTAANASLNVVWLASVATAVPVASTPTARPHNRPISTQTKPAAPTKSAPEPEAYQLATRSLAFSGWRPKNDDVSHTKTQPPRHSDVLKEGLTRSAWLVAEPLAAAWNEDGTCALALAEDRRDLTPKISCSSAVGDDAMRAINTDVLRGLAQWMRASDLAQIEFVIAEGRGSFHVRD